MPKFLTEFDIAIGRRLRQLRTDQATTQMELAERSGVSQNRISMIETGKSAVTADHIRRFSIALGLTMSAILGEDEPGTPEHAVRLALLNRDLKTLLSAGADCAEKWAREPGD